jgi:hypothetical protein
MSIPATGNDANDGATASTAKGSLAGIIALLNGIDPRGYVVTVKVSGLIAGNISWDFRDYPVNLTGTDMDSDGFSGVFSVNGGTVIPHNLRFGVLSANFPGKIYARGKNIKIVVTASASAGMYLLAECDFRGANIRYSGTMLHLVNAQLSISNFCEASFVAVDNPTITNARFGAYNGGGISLGATTFSGEATVAKEILIDSGIVPALPASIASGVFFAAASAMRIGAKGVARASRFINADGSMGIRGFGLVSVTKTATGVYEITTGLGFTSELVPNITPYSTKKSACADTHNTDNMVVRVFDIATGNAADNGFFITIF